MKKSRFFSLKIFIFLVVKFSVYLNRRVFVMGPEQSIQFHQQSSRAAYAPVINLSYCLSVQLGSTVIFFMMENGLVSSEGSLCLFLERKHAGIGHYKYQPCHHFPI